MGPTSLHSPAPSAGKMNAPKLRCAGGRGCAARHLWKQLLKVVERYGDLSAHTLLMRHCNSSGTRLIGIATFARWISPAAEVASVVCRTHGRRAAVEDKTPPGHGSARCCA